MKKILTLLLSLLLLSASAWAVVAPKTPYPYTQPDGSVIMLVNHGDEFFSWITCEGQIVEKDVNGYYRPVVTTFSMEQKAQAANIMRQIANESYKEAADSRLGMGEKNFMVILVEFADLSFTVNNPKEAFSRLLNEPGYAENGGTGSVKDFYTENSSGLFKPTFDVYGPVTVPKSYAYYGEQVGTTHDAHADEALYDACVILDESLDFSQYDLDKDGRVDNVFFFFAGHGQAEGGGENTIWPHKWQLNRHNGTFDGVRVWSYACASEYRGSSGEEMTGIGTFTHEFGHVIGLPDFYDTNNSTDGQVIDAPAHFSPMSSGNYLNSGRTPCYFTSIERQMLGWMGDLPMITASGEYTLGPLRSNSLPYAIPADVDGECFILEYRDGTRWDSYLPQGMVVYQMDRSSNYVGGGYTAYDLWDKRTINTYGHHACFRLIPAIPGNYNDEAVVYPGKGNKTDFVPVPWSGADLSVECNNIRFDRDNMKFSVVSTSRRRVWGIVKDSEGKPLEGAKVQMGVEEAPSSAPAWAGELRVRSTSLASNEVRYQVTSGADGAYEILLNEGDETKDFRISISRSGYIEQAYDISLGRRLHRDFVLRPIGSPAKADLQQYDFSVNQTTSRIGYTSNPQGMMGAAYFSAEELAAYAGMQIKTLTFVVGNNSPEVYALVDTDSERLMLQKVTQTIQKKAFMDVDVSAQKVYIPANTGLYFGFAAQMSEEDNYPVSFQKLPGGPGFYFAPFDLEDAPKWKLRNPGEGALLLSVTLFDGAAGKYLTLGALNVNSIDNPKLESGYVAGDEFSFKLVEADQDKPSTVSWFFDGVAQSGSSVTLTSGTHQVMARLTFPDGGEEDILLELKVQ